MANFEVQTDFNATETQNLRKYWCDFNLNIELSLGKIKLAHDQGKRKGDGNKDRNLGWKTCLSTGKQQWRATLVQ